MADRTSENVWRCELQPADAQQAGVLFVDLEGVDDIDFDTQAVSGLTTLFAEGAVIANGTLKIPKSAKKTFGKIEKRGPAESGKKQKPKATEQQEIAGANRKLAPLKPVRKVLAVRVVASDATTTASLVTLEGNIFGTGTASSPVSMSERFGSCSYGQTLMTPYIGQTPANVAINNGMVQVQISTSVAGKDSFAVEDLVESALMTFLNIPNLASVFDHVMLCLPPGTSGGWIAYGMFA